MQNWLTGWKRIGCYLDVSAKVARCWYKKYNLPVLRTPSQRPICKTDDLDRWVCDFNKKPPKQG